MDHDLPTPLAQAVFAHLTSTNLKRYVEIGGGTHGAVVLKTTASAARDLFRIALHRRQGRARDALQLRKSPAWSKCACELITTSRPRA
jgi:hypothetical protein